MSAELKCGVIACTAGCDCIGIMAVELDKQLIGLV
jgi:hypothetical protein